MKLITFNDKNNNIIASILVQELPGIPFEAQIYGLEIEDENYTVTIQD